MLRPILYIPLHSYGHILFSHESGPIFTVTKRPQKKDLAEWRNPHLYPAMLIMHSALPS